MFTQFFARTSRNSLITTSFMASLVVLAVVLLGIR